MNQPSNRLLIINGPNLNMLGRREPQLYGSETFEETFEGLKRHFTAFDLLYFQSNDEGAIIERLHQVLEEQLLGLVVNMGAFTHYSYAIRDALGMIPCPIVEVHISHIFEREAFRHQSVIAPVCSGMISGLGRRGYYLAIDWLIHVR